MVKSDRRIPGQLGYVRTKMIKDKSGNRLIKEVNHSLLSLSVCLPFINLLHFLLPLTLSCLNFRNQCSFLKYPLSHSMLSLAYTTNSNIKANKQFKIEQQLQAALYFMQKGSIVIDTSTHL